MILKVIENIWGEKLEIGYRGSPFTKDVIVIILITVLVIVEIPIILFFLKKVASTDFNFLFLSLALIALLLGVVIMFFLSSPPKLLNLSVSKAKGEIELIWRRNLLFKSQQIISNQLIDEMSINIIDTKPQSIIKMEIEKFNGEKISFRFSLASSDFHERLSEILWNLAVIIGFKSYTANRGVSSYRVLFTKSLEGNSNIDNFQRELKFENDIEKISDIKIPDLTIREFSEAKISLYKKSNFYDIIRLIFLFVIFPAVLSFAFMVKSPDYYVHVVVALMVYIFIGYMIRKLISPMETTIDILRSIVKVKKLFFSYSFPLSQIYQLELSDQISSRTGTLIFHVNARLKSGKAYQLFYTEFSNKDDKKYEVFENIMLLLKIIQSKLNVEIKDKTKHI